MQDPDRQVELTTAPNEPAAGAIVALLDEARAESVDIDWSEVETGDDSAAAYDEALTDRRRPAFIRFGRKLGIGFVLFTLLWTGGWLAFALVMMVVQGVMPEADLGAEAGAGEYSVMVVEEVHPLELLLDATFGGSMRMTPEEAEKIRELREAMAAQGVPGWE